MAGLGGALPNGSAEPAVPMGGGPFGALARAQYAALAALRWRLLANSLRSTRGAFEAVATALMFLFWGLMGLGLGTGAAVAAYFIASRGAWEFLPIVSWAVCLLWLLAPVVMASFQEQFDLAGMLRFPVSFGTFFSLYLVFGLADTSTLLGALCCLGIWTGILFARPDLLLWAALGLAGLAAFNVLLLRAVLAWLDRWLAQRKTREIVGALIMILVLSMQLFNPAFHQRKHKGFATGDEQVEGYRAMGVRLEPWLRTANAVQQWLPPGLAAEAAARAAEQKPVPALLSLGALGLWVLAAGGALGLRLRAEFRGENLGDAPARKQADRRTRAWVLDGSGPIAAVFEKELRTLMRSMPQIYMLAAPLVFVVLFSTMFRNSGSRAGAAFTFALPLCLAYALLGLTQLLFNNLGAEGAGIQIVFLSPTPIRIVLLAKNLFHSILFGLVALVAGALAIFRLGWPEGPIAAATVAWVVFALPVYLALGNILSLTMPYRVNLSRMTRQRGSQANSLISLLVQAGVMGVSAAVFGLCWLFKQPWLAGPVFLVLAVAAVRAWIQVLRNADALADRRMEKLIATVMKTD